MRVRPGKTRSAFGGVMALLVMLLGVVMMGSADGIGFSTGPFMLVWVLFGLGAAGVAFYNAFSRKGVPLYEIELDDEETSSFCPHCGRSVSGDDRFCRNCGTSLDG
jgi:ribosomal protein S27AE